MRVVRPFIAIWSILISIPALAADIVVMRDGSDRSGTLELSDDEQCRLSGTPIPIVEIRAIYLGGPRKELPVRSSAIVMRDGSVRTGRVTFVNRGTVDTNDAEIARSSQPSSSRVHRRNPLRTCSSCATGRSRAAR